MVFKKNKEPQRGFLLLEALTGLVIVLAMVQVILAATALAARYAVQAHKTTQAVRLASQVLDEMLCTHKIPAGFTRDGFTVTAQETEKKRYRVTVSWQDMRQKEKPVLEKIVLESAACTQLEAS